MSEQFACPSRATIEYPTPPHRQEPLGDALAAIRFSQRSTCRATVPRPRQSTLTVGRGGARPTPKTAPPRHVSYMETERPCADTAESQFTTIQRQQTARADQLDALSASLFHELLRPLQLINGSRHGLDHLGHHWSLPPWTPRGVGGELPAARVELRGRDRAASLRGRSGSGQRCQLYREHREAHAYAWREKGAHPHVRGRPLPPFRVLRWDASGEWSCDGVEERLPWRAMECE